MRMYVMNKLGENVPLIVDKAIDFMASSQAFMEYLQKRSLSDRVPEDIPEEKAPVYLERLAYYRNLYRPADVHSQLR